MNIVKFRDIILDENNNKNNLSEDKVLFFNEKLKGKYAYAVNFRHIIPFEDITQQQYYEISITENLDNIIYIEFIDVEDLIDTSKTWLANSITVFEEANKFTTDSDITLDELKRFRTWLSDMLYTLFNDSLDNITKEMLNYYREEMHDDTIEHLSYFANETEHDLIGTTNQSTCGCQNHTQMLNNQYAISSCNPIYIYRKGVYEKMVSVFSDIDFWLKLNKDFLNEIKRYIDGIIDCNLPLYTSQFSTTLHDCGCLTQNSAQEERMQILKDLSSCFYFLATDNYINKKNHISLTLNNWASLLYERMRWY